MAGFSSVRDTDNTLDKTGPLRRYKCLSTAVVPSLLERGHDLFTGNATTENSPLRYRLVSLSFQLSDWVFGE